MTNIEQEVLKALIDLLKTGDQYALIGIIIWFVFQLLKISLIGGFLWKIIGTVFSNTREIYKVRLEHKLTKVSLLSSELSAKICTGLEQFYQQNKLFTEDLVKLVTDLKTDFSLFKKK